MGKDYEIGQNANFDFHVTSDVIDKFAEFSGDYNQLHMSDDFSKNSGYGKRVAHGMIGMSLVSRLIGMYLPGEGSLWTDHSIKFTAPVRIDDKLNIMGTVTSFNKLRMILKLDVKITNQNNQPVLIGSFTVQIPEIQNSQSQETTGSDIIILGYSGGIGTALTTKILENTNYRVIGVSRSNKEDNFSKYIKNGRLITIESDITDPISREKFLNNLANLNINLHALINLFGHPIIFGTIEETNWESIHKVINDEIGSAYEIMRNIIKYMDNTNGGRIIMLSSIAADNYKDTNWLTYQITKSIINTLTKLSASEFGKKNITVNALSPGILETSFSSSISKRVSLKQITESALQRSISVSEISENIMFLLSSSSKNITGQIIKVDGAA